MSDASREDLATNAHFEPPKEDVAALHACIARLREELAAAKGEAKHWCDHATKLVSDLIRADDLRATAVADLAAARRSLEEARALLARCWSEGDLPYPLRSDMSKFTRAFLAPPTPTPPPCASWCGNPPSPNDGRRADTPYWRTGDADSPYYCTSACRDAGAPRNPVKPTLQQAHTCRHGKVGLCGRCQEEATGFARSRARMPPMPNPQGVEVGHRYRSGSQVGEVIKLDVNSRGQDTAEFRWADGGTTVLAVSDLEAAGFVREP